LLFVSKYVQEFTADLELTFGQVHLKYRVQIARRVTLIGDRHGQADLQLFLPA